MNDSEAYTKFKSHRKWFSKLWLSESLGYQCGPSGIAPHSSGWYVVRPIMNLSGMGLGAKKIYIDVGDSSKVPPGYFWSEWFSGTQYSVCFKWIDGVWCDVSCWEADRNENNLPRFNKWSRCENQKFALGEIFNQLHTDVDDINVEFIDQKIIEVHLRKTPDPDYDVLIPIWSDQHYLIANYEKLGYSYIESYDDADGFLKPHRIGFVVKNNCEVKY
jgi:hypothetical protein